VLLNTIDQKHDRSTLQSDLIQKDGVTILGDTEYLKRRASEQTNTLATLSQKISDIYSLINPNSMRPLEEPISQNSYGNQQKVSSDSGSIVRDVHRSTIEKYGLPVAPATVFMENKANESKRRQSLNGKLWLQRVSWSESVIRGRTASMADKRLFICV
jgi:DNA-binding protein Fis